MTDETKTLPLPVAGYTPQSAEAIALANEGNQLEERYLRWLDKLTHSGITRDVPKYDQRFVALARTNIQDGAMWAIRAIFQPTRIALPEDVKPVAAEIDGDGA